MTNSSNVPLDPVLEGEARPAAAPVPDPTRWRALGVIAIAQLMVVLDASIVNLALPSAKASLGISDANQQWVITAYTLTFGGLLLLGGRIADYVGRKRATTAPSPLWSGVIDGAAQRRGQVGRTDPLDSGDVGRVLDAAGLQREAATADTGVEAIAKHGECPDLFIQPPTPSTGEPCPVAATRGATSGQG